MQFSSAFVEQLRNRITLSEIVGKQVRLVHRSGGSYGGLCPFHPEKTPSFTVSNEKGFYHCFGCGAHGDAIAFLMAKEGVSFVEAVTLLAEQVGMALPEPDKREQEYQKKTSSAYTVLEQACLWFQQQLLAPEGREALGYFKRRGIGAEVIKKFRLGFALDQRHGLEQYLKKQGVSEAQLLEVGLIGKTEKGENYDRFRGRIMFPIMDTKNRVIAFGGRIMHEGQPKYLNSPETVLFKKSEVLYAEHLAKKPAYERREMVVVEGYMDVIALHMAGFTTAVAPLGTALTDLHLKRLWQYAKEPIICLDGDNAGKRATMRVAMHSLPLLKPGYSLRFVQLPEGEDPDEIVKKQGAAFFERLISSALPLSDMIWNHEYEQQQLVTPEQKSEFEQRMMHYADAITDTQLQGYYRRYFSSKIWEMVKRPALNMNVKQHNKGSERLIMPEKQNITERCQYTLMALILKYPLLLDSEEVENTFINIEFIRNDLDKLRTAILELRNVKSAGSNSGAETDAIKDFRPHLEKSGFSDNIQYLYGNSNFLGNMVACNKEEMLVLWHYALDKYHLSRMQEEHKAALAEMTEDAEKKALEYYKQITVLEKSIFEKEQIILNRD